MQTKYVTLFSLGLLGLTSIASAMPTQHVVIAPTCLMKHVDSGYTTLSSTQDFVLLETNDAGINKLIDIKTQYRATGCGGFMDVTEEWNTFNKKKLNGKGNAKTFLLRETKPVSTLESPPAPLPYQIQYEKTVNQVLKDVNPELMWASLQKLSSFPDRAHNSKTGAEAAEWIKSQIEGMAKTYHRDDVTTYFVKTGSYKQPSLVVKFGSGTGPGIVIGGHMDTLEASAWGGNKPGADDDGSGSMTALEVARTILASGLNFKKPIYFVWYAAEEIGLVGSKYVVADFKNKGIPVDAVLHFDMTGYAHQKNMTMWLMDDNTNKALTAYLETLINTYVKQPVKHTTCGYACSDHATWTKNGFIAAMPFESSMGTDNPNIHTSRDVIENLTKEHMTDYAKLGVAFAIELAEPQLS